MADVTPLIVGGGVAAGSPYVLNEVLYVTNVNPPQAASFPALNYAKDTVSGVIYAAVPTSGGGFVPTNQNATERLRVKGGAIIEGPGTDSIAVGRGAAAAIPAGANGADTIAIGRGIIGGTVTTDRIVIGATANVSGGGSVVIGFNAGSGSANPIGGVFIGNGAQASANAGGASCVVIGDSALFSGGNNPGALGVVIGPNANGSHPACVVIGASASSAFSSAVAQNTVTIGNGANSGKAGTTVIGGAATSVQTASVVIGSGATATNTLKANSIVIGQTANVAGSYSVVIGTGSIITSDQAIAIGAGATDIAANTCQLGTANTQIVTFVLGNGNTQVNPTAVTLRFTNGSGADNAAGDITVQSALSTGAGTPSRLLFTVGAAHGSDSVLQTPFNALVLDASTTAGDIRALVWDVTAGASVRVSRGAADSGGVGFRLLRVPN